MNERINVLRLQAGISRLEDDSRLVVINKEGKVIDPLIGLQKFAELIVKECVSICENSEIPFDIEVWRDSTKKEMTALTSIALGNLIKAHFGVK